MKPIAPTTEQTQQLISEFTKYITALKTTDGKISFSASLEATASDKVNVSFTTEAYIKMLSLVMHTDTEIGWHGLVTRVDNNFLITDIIVYPQKVTGATVTPDQIEYQNWLMAQPDEVFFKIRFQGHSHVNFGVSPSGTDTDYYNKILQTMQNNEYYIFLIMNKNMKIHINVYDFTNNTLYESQDINLGIKLDSGVVVTDWVKEQQDTHVKTPQATQTTTTNTFNTGKDRQPMYYVNGLSEWNEKEGVYKYRAYTKEELASEKISSLRQPVDKKFDDGFYDPLDDPYYDELSRYKTKHKKKKGDNIWTYQNT